MVELLKHALQDERGFGSQHVLITEEQLHMLAVFVQRRCQNSAEYAGDGGIKRRDERKRDPDYGRVFGTMYQPEISSV